MMLLAQSGWLISIGIVGFISCILVVSSLFTVEQQTAAIIERFGKFQRIASPGLDFKIPLIDRVATRIPHRVRELEIRVESKTKDDVFVDLVIAIQYFVRDTEESIQAAYYKLINPEQQINSYVFDSVRSLVPGMPIDNVFSQKEKIAIAVKDRLDDTMEKFGYTIMQVLVNDIQPDADVKKAMNRVNATARLKKAAKNEAEAHKIRTIAEAEAEARAKELQGVGIARQRLAIANGLKESVSVCSKAGISPEEATKMVLLTHHYDTVTAVGAHSKSTIMMIPYTSSGMSQVGDQVMQALLTTTEAGKPEPAAQERPRRASAKAKPEPLIV